MTTDVRPQKLMAGCADWNDTQPIMSTNQYLGSALHGFLEARRVKDRTAEWSMTGMGDIKGKWLVSDADYPTFMDLMHEYLVTRNLRPNNFVEQRHSDGLTPLLVDLDFRYPAEMSLTRSFTTEHIEAFVHEILNVLKEYFDLKERHQPILRFFVTLRPQPYQDVKSIKKDIKDGVHIVCPDFTVTPEQHAVIRHLLLEREAVKRSFDETGYSNKDDDVFDKSLVAKNGWFFYGETKPTIPPYLLSHVFKFNTRSGKLTTEPNSTYDRRQLIELLSIRYKRTPVLTVLERSKTTFQDVLQRIQASSSAIPAAQNQADAGAATASAQQLTGMIPIVMDSFNQIVSTEDDIALARRLAIECLSAERADDYINWMRTGWCLRNIDSSDEMFDTWMKFSEKSGKSGSNNTAQLRTEWHRGTMRRVNGSPGLTMGSLKMWAREDNSAKYKTIMDGDIISFITKAAITFTGGTHHHVAKMVHNLYYDIYKCTVEGRSTEWYEFKDHTWNPMPHGLLIKTTITDDIARKVDSARHSLMPPLGTDPDYEEKMKKYQDNMKKLLKLQENLYNANFKDNVMKEGVQLFYDPNFYKRINQNPYLVGCANGILNLREPVFDEAGNPVRYTAALHPGTAEDYVTLKAGVTADAKEAIEYLPYNPEDPVQMEIMDFFKKLFPADDLREYVLTLAAGCLEGANKEQCFYIMTGSGGNGKTKFTDLMLSVLGQYAGSLASTALTRKRPESGAANPDIMSIKGCRFVEMKEPDDGEPLNSARMKQFSGEDLVEARGLFKDQEKFKITGKIFLSCNRMPPIHSMDGGTWRRIRVIPFDSRFLPANDPMIDPSRHIYPRDDMMDEKMKSWRVPFFSLLVHYYQTRYCPNGIKSVPPIVLQASENYKGSNDSFGKFIKARVRRVIGFDDPPTFKDFVRAYKGWSQDQNGKRLTDNEMRIRLNELYQAPADGKTYLHLQLFNSDEEAEEYDQEQSQTAA